MKSGKFTKEDLRADQTLKQAGRTLRSYGARQSIIAFADALCLALFYFLISDAVADFVIKDAPINYTFIYLAIFIVPIRLTLGILDARINALMSTRAEVQLRLGLIDRIIEKGAFCPSYSKGLVMLVNEAVDNIIPFYTVYLKGKRKAVAFVVVLYAAIVTASFKAALVLLIITPLIPLFMVLIGRVTKRVSDRQLNTLTRLSERFYQSFLNLPLIRIYGLEVKEGSNIARASKRWRVETLQILYVAFISAATLEFFATAGIAFCAVLLGFAIYENAFPYQSALFVLLCAPEYFLPLRSLGSYFHQKQRAFAAASKIASLLLDDEKSKESADLQKNREVLQKNCEDLKSVPEKESLRTSTKDLHLKSCALQDPLTTYKKPLDFQKTHRKTSGFDAVFNQDPTGFLISNRFSHSLSQGFPIVVDNLCAAYPDGRIGLEDVSLKINTGKITALKGPSGIGKTSLLLTLFGKLKIVSGQVFLGSEDYFSLFDPSRTAFIPQEPHLFYGTLRDNLTLWHSRIDDEVLIENLRKAGALDLLKIFPEGLDKKVGEDSRLVSGGQMRLIALARTMLKDASLILLDEPSASLDEESERLFLTRMRDVYEGKTVLVATHRSLTLSFCDEVIDLEA